jgi:hypothetical protein
MAHGFVSPVLSSTGIVTYSQTCPRCGQDFTSDDANSVAEAVVAHAKAATSWNEGSYLPTCEGRRPDECED